MKIRRTKHKNSKQDLIGKWLSCSFAWFVVLIFIAILVFVIISAIPGFQEFGLDGILGTLHYNLSEKEASIWAPLSITLLVSFGSVLLATPIGIKTATFIKFRLKKHHQRFASILVQSLSGIPSVVFGLFAINSLGPIISRIFTVDLVFSIINAIIMLTFMILPTIVALVLNTYNNISDELIFNPLGLGITRTKAIYTVYKRKARSGIVVAVVIALGRAIGETMALSMVLTSESYSVLGSGLINTLESSLGTLGSIIATNMFSETGGAGVRGVLYAFGIFLFIVIMLLNVFILVLSKKHTIKNKHLLAVVDRFNRIIDFIPNHLFIFWSRHQYQEMDINDPSKKIDVNRFICYRLKQKKFVHLKSYYYIFLEYLCSLIAFSFLIWISTDILVNGIRTISHYNTTIFDYSFNTTGQAIVNTLIIIFLSLCISIPISLLVAIFLNEFNKKESRISKIILFFVDSLGSSPSIIFGMFGLSIFIELFGLTSAGTVGKSLLAGIFTISIVILPTLIRTIQQSLENISLDCRINAYALGCSKWKTIWKVVIPSAIKALSSSVVLAIGRIIAETAPLFLTAGLSSSSTIGLLLPGQTITTRIYAQLSSTDINAFESITYECAFVGLALIIVLIWIGNYLIPKSREIKIKVLNIYFNIVNLFVLNNNEQFKKYKKQIINKTLYLSYSQADYLKLHKARNRIWYHNHKIYLIKYIKDEKLALLTTPKFIKAIL